MSYEANLAVLQDFFRERFDIALSDKAIENIVHLVKRVGDREEAIPSLIDFLVVMEASLGYRPEIFRVRIRGGLPSHHIIRLEALVEVDYPLLEKHDAFRLPKPATITPREVT